VIQFKTKAGKQQQNLAFAGEAQQKTVLEKNQIIF
jgi:hypothetical protein